MRPPSLGPPGVVVELLEKQSGETVFLLASNRIAFYRILIDAGASSQVGFMNLINLMAR